jgi:soluble lytic murein transglycosylase-like protein
MRGIGCTLSRLPAAWALLAGAAILAVASAEKAYAGTLAGADDTAMAIPRVAPHGAAGVALPQPLPPSEAVRIRRIFALQSRGDLAGAERETGRLDTYTPLGRAMLGHILADRYLGRFTRNSADRLESWLAVWPDLPDAPAIHALLLRHLPRGTPAPPAPAIARLARAATRPPVPEEIEPAGMALMRNAVLDHAVHEAARSNRPYAAAQLLARTRGLTDGYGGVLAGEAAQILFTRNRDQEAYDTGAATVGACRPVPRDGCGEAALPAYIAGLAAWRMRRPELARPMFVAAWRARLTDPSLRAAAAFWAARAHLRIGALADYVPWMKRAVAEPRTFYGLLARHTLGLGSGFRPDDRETLSEADLDAVAATPQGLHAFALLQVGQTARAEAELRLLWPAAQATPLLGRAIMLVAARAGLVELAAQLAELVQSADSRAEPAPAKAGGARFAVPRLSPAGGFTVDPAMIYALARIESNFNAAMVSRAGARGLMQIMPQTARFIVHGNAASERSGALHDPAVNLALGQRYLGYLARQEAVDGDLIRLLASYNSGPGGFARWSGTIRDNGDPLLFIEAVPIDETRAFIPRVLTYTWIYAARLQLPTPSLDELAAGAWPRYHVAAPLQQPPPRFH